MTIPDAEGTALADGAHVPSAVAVGLPIRPVRPLIPKRLKSKNIQVSPAVLEAAQKEIEDLVRDLRTSRGGLTNAEAEERARVTGLNEVADLGPQA